MKQNVKLLERAGLRRVRPGLWVRGAADELSARIDGADLFISDLDECMFPFITQAEAGRLILERIIRDVEEREGE